MKTSLWAVVLALSAVLAYGPAASAQAQPGASSSSAPVIKDPAEYNAYVSAIQQQDNAAKISGLEAFLTQYPNSVMKVDALEVLMGAYQATGNQAKVVDTANKVLVASPDDVRALVILAYLDRAGQKWQDAQQHASHGLDALPKMTKPDGVSEADFAKQKTQFAGVLNSVAGFSALQLKDNANAQKYLRAAVEGDPNNVENIYPLALAYLTASPSDDVNGLWFICRAANLITDANAKAGVVKFGHSRYVKYHGAEDGWNELMAQTASTPLPPAGFTIAKYVPPTPAQQAAALVKSKEPKDMSFAEWELVLSAGAPEDAGKVWDAIKGKTLQMEGTVISAAPDKLEIAASQDDIDAKRADIVLLPEGTIPAKLMPKEAATLDFAGTPTSYTPSPFVMTMEKGALLTKAAPAPAKKPPVRRRPTTSH